MICKEYSTIFIHIPKTAGQSIENFFLHKVGLDWERRESFLLRPKKSNELGPPRLAHLRVEEYVHYGYISSELFSSYFTFSIVRNPWDRMISFYYYLQYHKRMNFTTFIKEFYRIYKEEENYWFVRPQYEYLQNNKGKIEIDYIGRFENLQKSFDYICKQLGFKRTLLPKINISTHRPKKYPSTYQHYYNSKIRNIVAEIHQKDIEYFKYKF